MATITFSIANKFIQLGPGDVSTDAQEIADAIRDWQDELENMYVPNFLETQGKTQLRVGVFTGITLIISDGWKIRGDDTFGTPTTIVVEGDVVTDDGSSPFEPVTNVSYDRGLSTAPSIVEVNTGGGGGGGGGSSGGGTLDPIPNA